LATSAAAALTPAESALLDKMSAWAEAATYRPDSKARQLLAWLHATIRPNGVWSDERVILFTEYRATQNWLFGLLAAEGFTEAGRLMTLYGGMAPEEREAIKAAFLTNPQDSPVRILLATDAASEGIDLQRYCHRLIHIEIPWNPNRMEQRNGRIDRHGQRYHPHIYHFVGQGYQAQLTGGAAPSELEADLEYLMRVAIKVNQIREDLGSVGAVIADQVVRAMLGDGYLFDTGEAERRNEPARRQLKFARDLRAQIERLSDQLRESRQTLRLYPENIEAVVTIALELAGQPPLESTTLSGVWPDPNGQRRHSPVFRLPALQGSWQRAVQGIPHPHTGVMRPITFDHTVASGRDDVVLIHLNHILVQMSLRLLRAEVWSREGAKRLQRATARVVPSHLIDTPVVIGYARLVITGGDSQRLHEEIITAGGEIREGRFRRLNVGQVQEALAAASPTPVSNAVATRLINLWPALQPALMRSLEVRGDERSDSLANVLADRANKEAADIRSVLQELARTIGDELAEPEPVQLSLWSPAERDQLVRNEAALRRRLEQIPAEIEQEMALIRSRYADPQPRLFPVAVTFLIPDRMT
ncbi:MAG: DISARM system SNF2-like helicase DrmD, partial [Caldilineaceae bacterium]|nr:DISARM system SNF2-like helicase DrmD [Caldilineaceae bacterium]